MALDLLPEVTSLSSPNTNSKTRPAHRMSDTVKDGIYRFQSLSPADGNDYLTLKTRGQVEGGPLDSSSNTQKWKVTKRSDGLYDVVNLSNDALLAIASPNGVEQSHTLNVRGDITTPWDFELFGSKILIKGVGQLSGEVVDLSDRNRCILRKEVLDRPQQIWILEVVDNTPSKVQPTWVLVHGTNIPDNAIQGGWEADGSPLYVARVEVTGGKNGTLHRAGYAGHHVDGICRVAYGPEHKFNQYEVLVADPGTYKWVPYFPGTLTSCAWSENHTPARPILVMRGDPNFGRIFVTRTCYEHALIPGHATTTKTWLGYDGKAVEVTSLNSEVLCYAD